MPHGLAVRAFKILNFTNVGLVGGLADRRPWGEGRAGGRTSGRADGRIPHGLLLSALILIPRRPGGRAGETVAPSGKCVDINMLPACEMKCTKSDRLKCLYYLLLSTYVPLVAEGFSDEFRDIFACSNRVSFSAVRQFLHVRGFEIPYSRRALAHRTFLQRYLVAAATVQRETFWLSKILVAPEPFSSVLRHHRRRRQETFWSSSLGTAELFLTELHRPDTFWSSSLAESCRTRALLACLLAAAVFTSARTLTGAQVDNNEHENNIKYLSLL